MSASPDLQSPSALPVDPPPFVADTAAAFAAVRRALADLLAALPGDYRKPPDLQRALKLDYKLCWQVFNVIRADDSLAAAAHVPGPPSLKRLLAAADRRGAPPELTRALRSAVDDFNAVVDAHAGDRTAFHSMVAAHAKGDPSTESLDLLHRRNAFKSQSHLWGIQTDTYCCICFVRPDAANSGTDELVINARYGIHRLRPGAPLAVHGYRHSSGSPPARDPLDPAAQRTYGAPLLPDFCSQPLPKFKTLTRDGGVNFTQLDSDDVGRNAAVNLVFAGIARNVPFTEDNTANGERPTANGPHVFSSSIRLNTPNALLVSDVLVHRPTYGRITPELYVFPPPMLGDESPQTVRDLPHFPIHERVQSLGRATDAPQTPDLPRYPDLLRRAAAAVHWDLADFDLYRLRLPFPILHSVTRLQFHYR